MDVVPLALGSLLGNSESRSQTLGRKRHVRYVVPTKRLTARERKLE